MKIFIYSLTEPDGITVRYIGKSNEFRIKKRLVEHCRVSNTKFHTHKNMWIRSLLNKGQQPLLHIIEECQEENYRLREKYWIDFYKKQGYNLTNGTEGGEGACRIHNRIISEDQKQKISKTLKKGYKENPNRFISCSNAGKKSRGVERQFKFKQTSDNIGVSFSYKNRKGVLCKWRAYAHINGKHKHIGLYDTEQAAISAREKFLRDQNYL